MSCKWPASGSEARRGKLGEINLGAGKVSAVQPRKPAVERDILRPQFRSRRTTVMISRYSLPEMAELWSDQARYASWAKVEVLAAEAQALLGRIPEGAVADIRRARVPSAARVAELERERDHEVLSFLAA